MDTIKPNPTPHVCRHTRPSGSAFSLIELVLVLTIISVLAAIAVPRYAGALARYRADAAARRVIADLEYARQRARASSSRVVVVFQIGSELIVLQGTQSMDNPSAMWETDIAGRPYYADLVSAGLGGDTQIEFNGYGEPDTGGTVVLAVGTESRTVVLDPDTGKAVAQ